MTDEEIKARMAEIQQILKDNDYKTLKKMEDALSDEEWIAHVEQREVLRTEYNVLGDALIHL